MREKKTAPPLPRCRMLRRQGQSIRSARGSRRSSLRRPIDSLPRDQGSNRARCEPSAAHHITPACLSSNSPVSPSLPPSLPALVTLQDLVVKLSEVLVSVSAIGSVEGPPGLVEEASATMVALATSRGSREKAPQASVLQALIPVILMASGKADVPPR